MRHKTVARRYAASLIELAIEEGELGGLFCDMIVIQEIFAGVPNLIAALSDERLRLQKRIEVAKRIVDKLKLKKRTGDAMLLLLEKGRISMMPDIAHAALKGIRLRKSLMVACAQVADRELEDEVQRRIEETLSEIIGLTVECEVSVDPTLMGGFVVELGDFRFDSSIRGKLTRMKEDFFSEAKGV